MSEQVKAKIELNKVTHSVRAAQAVLQYGVGAMVDFPDQTLSTGAERVGSMMIVLQKPWVWTTLRYPPILRIPVFLNGISALSAENSSH